MKKLIAAAALFAAIPALAHAADLGGTWKIALSVQGQTSAVSCVFTQAGNAISGPCTGQAGTPHTATGTVDGDKVTFAYDTSIQGQALKITYTADVQADGTLKGNADIGGMMAAPFTAKKD